MHDFHQTAEPRKCWSLLLGEWMVDRAPGDSEVYNATLGRFVGCEGTSTQVGMLVLYTCTVSLLPELVDAALLPTACRCSVLPTNSTPAPPDAHAHLFHLACLAVQGEPCNYSSTSSSRLTLARAASNRHQLRTHRAMSTNNRQKSVRDFVKTCRSRVRPMCY
jgi:hypothetical protein